MRAPNGEIDCVIPAAGESRRMDRWKLLLPFDGETVVEKSVRNALGACSRVILVAGYREAEIEALFSEWDSVLVVSNPDYHQGMFSSIRAGAAHVGTARFFVALADMPFILPQVYQTVLALGLRRPECVAVRPVYRGIGGHPVLFGKAIIDKILGFDNAHTMREVLRNVRTCRLPTDDQSVVRDIDTPEDYEAFAESPPR